MKYEKNFGHKISKWRTVDIAVCWLTVFFSSFYVLSSYVSIFMPVFYTAFIFLLICSSFRKLYYTDIPTNKTVKIIRSTFRMILYTAVVIVLVIPFTMHSPWKWYYPVQRAFYLTGRSKSGSLHTLLPEHLPDEISSYEVHFVPKVLQGSARVEMKFYTDSAAIENFRNYAAGHGAEYLDIGAYYTDLKSYGNNKINFYLNLIERDDASPDGAEAYEFSGGTYILNENTGYFRLYW